MVEGWIYLPNTEFMDQIQQNLIKPTNHKKHLGLFLVGIFGFRTKLHKTRLENKEGGSNFVINQGS